MKVAIVGSRTVSVDISEYLPEGITEIISGGAKGIDKLAEAYADEHKIPKTIITPDYVRYGRAAPLKRNEIIVDSSDMIVAIWDGKSRGTKYSIDYACKMGKAITIYIITTNPTKIPQ